MRAGIDGQWPAGLAYCTGLQTLHLEGISTAPLPNGPYLNRLRELTWHCDPAAAVPHALKAATALEELCIGIAPERMADCIVLDSMPNLRSLQFSTFGEHLGALYGCKLADALLDLKRRLRAEVMLSIQEVQQPAADVVMPPWLYDDSDDDWDELAALLGAP